MKLLTFVAGLWFAGLSPAHATEVTVQGRTFYGSPAYYSTTENETEITITSPLPWGSRVIIHHGYAGHKLDTPGVGVDWQVITRTEAEGIAPWVWRVRLAKVLHYRSSETFFTHLQFVIHVIGPEGQSQWIRGSDSRMGFYQVLLMPVQPFVQGAPYPGPMGTYDVEIVVR
jgi:hypothetical protein